MTSSAASLWPYLLMTVFWIAICGWFLQRAWKGRAPERRSPNWLEDTQAGRI